jgi:copper chaperone
MTIQQLNIEGMSCNHCVNSLKNELAKLAGVVIEDVQIGSARIAIDESAVSIADIERAVNEAGYRLVTA